MESLAYLYLAQEYENPEDRAIALFNSSVGLTALEHLPKAALGMALLCSSGVGGLSQAAQAQTYSSEGLYPSSVYATNETNESRYVYIQPNDLGYSGYSAIYPCCLRFCCLRSWCILSWCIGLSACAANPCSLQSLERRG
jgi:hypothetical protein